MKRLLSFTALILLSVALNAQEYEQTIRKWSDGPLSWDDFSSFSNSNTLMSDLYYGWRGEHKIYKKGNLRIDYNDVYTYMNTEQSWVDPYSKSPSLLQYEQMVFDYAELCRRQYMQEMRNDTEHKYSSKEMSDYYFNKIARYEAEVGPQCDYGRDSSLLNYYSALLAEQLAGISDYREPSIRERDWPFGIEFGYVYEWIPGADSYLSDDGCIRMGFDLFYKRFRFGLDIMPKFDGVNTVAFNHDDVLWATGLTRRYHHTEFNFGYSVLDNDWFRINPFVGIGLSRHFIVLGKDQDGEEIRDEMGGLRLQAGICGDFKAWRSYDSRFDQYIELDARFLAYVARTDFPGYGPLWSYNFGLLFYMNGWM